MGLLGASWRRLGPSWRRLGGVLGASWENLGGFLGRLGDVLERPGAFKRAYTATGRPAQNRPAPHKSLFPPQNPPDFSSGGFRGTVLQASLLPELRHTMLAAICIHFLFEFVFEQWLPKMNKSQNYAGKIVIVWLHGISS